MDNLQKFRKFPQKIWKKSGIGEKFHFSFHYFIRVLGGLAGLSEVTDDSLSGLVCYGRHGSIYFVASLVSVYGCNRWMDISESIDEIFFSRLGGYVVDYV